MIDCNMPQTFIGDPIRLRQVLINILANAVKFTDSGEIITSAEARQSEHGFEIHFKVKDTGIGISEDKMGRLFNPFTQVDASTTRRFGGTGLGLAVARSLVELSGGGSGQIALLERAQHFILQRTSLRNMILTTSPSGPSASGLQAR